MKRLSSPSPLSDEDVIAQYRESLDKELISILFKRYTHLIFGVSMKYLKNEDLAKDSVMDIFESLFNKLLEHEIHHFKAWLLQVSRNHCLMVLRSRKIEIPHELVENTLPVHLEQDSSEQEFRLSQLEKHLQYLDEHQRKCLELFYLQKMSYTQVAEITGYSLLQVKSYLQNGKRNLKIRLLADERG